MAAYKSGLAPVVVCQLLALGAAPAAADQSSGAPTTTPAPMAVPRPYEEGTRKEHNGDTPASRLLISDRATSRVLQEALPEAWRLLEEPGCHALLSELKDEKGNPLAGNLSKGAVDLQDHLARLVFVDGSETKACAKGALAATEPGSRVVHVCSSRLTWTWQQNRRHVIAGLIHEALHTLGLGENPPSSAEITSLVLKRCGVDREQILPVRNLSLVEVTTPLIPGLEMAPARIFAEPPGGSGR